MQKKKKTEELRYRQIKSDAVPSTFQIYLCYYAHRDVAVTVNGAEVADYRKVKCRLTRFRLRQIKRK